MKIMSIAFFLLIALLMPPKKTYAWGPVAHYLMSVKANCTNLCTNLPDAWPNKYWVSITEWFSWSHGVQTRGDSSILPSSLDNYIPDIVTNGLSIVPNVPIYPDDGRYPDFDIYDLGEKKIIQDMPGWVMSAQSFMAHNAEDRLVHFNYFLGGTTGNWIIRHKFKEKWADYMLFLDPELGDGEFGPVSYDPDTGVPLQWGFATKFLGQPIGSGDIIPCTANSQIIHIAQKVYRKNRRAISTSSPQTLDEVDSVEKIDQRIAQLRSDMNSYLRGLSAVGVAHDVVNATVFESYAGYDFFDDLASHYEWKYAEVKSLFWDSVAATTTRIQSR